MRIYKPMLCKLTEKPFVNPHWIWEQKLDGIRIIAYPDGKLITRTGKDITHAFPEVANMLPPHMTLDGEIVSGTAFNNIQHRLRQNNVEEAAEKYPVEFKVFDILSLDSLDLSKEMLTDRKKILSMCLPHEGKVSYTQYFDDGNLLYNYMEILNYEGVVGKNLYEPYLEDKRVWVKVKCWKYDIFMCVGFTPGTGWRKDMFGALVLEDMDGRPVGQVGTGFDVATINKLKVKETPFPVRIKYLERNKSGILRLPVYQGCEE